MQKATNRLEFLDFLRFIAALSVMLQHILESKSAAFVGFSTYYFQFGVFGVTLFFLTSGFIIPVSLEKQSSLTTFWTSRIFRLFPLYLTSLLVSVVMIYLGYTPGPFPSGLALFANGIMLAKFLGQPLVQGLYWTLNLEMVFYLLVTGLFIVGLLQKSLLLAYLALAGALMVGVVGTQVFQIISTGWGLAFQLATMFVGTVYFRYMSGIISVKAWVMVLATALLVLFMITTSNLYGQDYPSALGTRSFWPVSNAYLFAYLLFTGCFLFRHLSYPKPFLFLGLISYSLYLVQASLLPLILPLSNNVFIASFLAIGCTILVSYITYRFIEKPFIEVGRKLTRRKASSSAA